MTPPAARASPGWLRVTLLGAAAVLDLVLAGAGGVAFHWVGVPRQVAYMAFAHLVFGTTAAVLAYVVLARLVFGTTAGERLGHVSFRGVSAPAP